MLWLRRHLPLFVLACLAVLHVTLVARFSLSPWLGGGFGMFSTVDRRHLVAVAEGAGGAESVLELPAWLDDPVDRARALPSPGRLAAIADALALETPSCAALRVEVWRSEYEPGTLRPRGEQLAVATRPCGPR